MSYKDNLIWRFKFGPLLSSGLDFFTPFSAWRWTFYYGILLTIIAVVLGLQPEEVLASFLYSAGKNLRLWKFYLIHCLTIKLRF
jgi:hypothetical protein